MATIDKILTIIIPTYNMEKYLRHCLDSLIVPNMEKVEVLVINDGSKDSSSAIGHEYQDKYPQTFRVIDKENGNYGSCVNRGLKEAKGKYVKVLDADDSFDTASFEQYIEVISNLDVDLVLNDTQIVDEGGHNTKYWNVQNAEKLIVNDFNSKFLNPTMHSVAYRTKNLKRLGYSQTEGISYTDQEWIFWPMSVVDTYFYMPIPLYRYLLGREGQTMDPKIISKALPQEIIILERMVGIWEKYHRDWTKTHEYMSRKLRSWNLHVFCNSIIIGAAVQKQKFKEMDLKFRKNYPLYYKFSQSFLVGTKLLFPYLWYWRIFHTIKPFGFIFKLKSWYDKRS